MKTTANIRDPQRSHSNFAFPRILSQGICQIAIAFVLPILVLGMGVFFSVPAALASGVPNAPQVAQLFPQRPIGQFETPSLPQPTQRSNFVTKTVADAGKAVVQINVSRSLGGNVPDFLQPFFGGPQAPGGPALQGIGSGFVITSDGKILTNAHVVNEADTVMAAFADGRVLEGKVLGKDPVTDLAVIQVEAQNLPTVKIGDSDRVEQGQWAIAIGNPLGLQETVTVGVVSATHRFSGGLGVPDRRISFIQTDAAINPGNSGGPLLNENGEVIGVNTAIIGGAQGLGFAIPINAAREIAQELIATGTVEHPYIGVQMVALSPQSKQIINQMPGMQVEAEEGILVMGVEGRSPAAKAGLRSGDLVLSVNGRPVRKIQQFQEQIEETGVGGELELEVQRDRRTKTITVRPEQFPAQA